MTAAIVTILVLALIAVASIGAAFCAVVGFMFLINYKR